MKLAAPLARPSASDSSDYEKSSETAMDQQKTPALSRARGFRLVYGVAVTYFRVRKREWSWG